MAKRPTRRTSNEMYERLHPSFFRTDDNAASNFTLITTARLFFRDIAKQISEAKYSVDLQFYTLEADREVMRVLAVCQTAAERGVKVRVLVDHLASDPRRLLATRRARKRMSRSANIEIRQSRVRENATKLTVRDHKKVVVIDGGEYAYIGGINLARRRAYDGMIL